MQWGRALGLFFALPTTAAAVAMLARVAATVRRLFNAPPSLPLAHARTGLNDGDRPLVTVGVGTGDQIRDAEALRAEFEGHDRG
ncbi:hypothetical protein IT41_19705 [Paracoccus halophilus]|uniref:Uncharacterized protein n=1 Tax=Paracoccus halophilus TaxID=376733 RepID=A0A099EUD7_9RHOB|nr:hypothetical protein [Paracoccus halophilus]KGJ01622.1 hypothetical protein IT41_19705 [Paracoccus halophilus]